jgi:TolA-binding protein
MKLVVAIILLLAALPTLHAEPAGIDVTAVARKVRQSIVLLVVRDEAGHELGSATGFIVSNDGKLITSRHVVHAVPRVVAKAWNGRQYPVVGALAEDAEQDLVLLKIDTVNLPGLPLGSSAQLTVGTPVVVVGNPLGLDGTATAAHVLAFRDFDGERRWIEITPSKQYAAGFEQKTVRGQGLQVTTPVTFGSSGSPVVNAQGEVVGIVAMARGFSTARAVPVETAKQLLTGARSTASPQALTNLVHRNANQSDLSLDRDLALATRAFAAGDYATAVRHAKEAVARFPGSARAHQFLGQSLGQNQQYDEAVASFEHALQLRPSYPEALYGLTLAHAMLGHSDKARDALRELEKLQPVWARSLSRSLPELAR